MIVIGYTFFTMNFGLSKVQGALNVNGIAGDISLSRDDNGAVYVKADSDDDVFFGIGFAHAQDRLWQLELQRRISQGRLSEVFGVSSVKIDAQIRTLGLYESAQSAWDALSPQAKSSLTAYSAGINAWIKAADSLPLEFDMLDVTPEPWTEIDSLAWSKVFALNLSNSMWSEISQFFARSYLDDAQKAELFAGSLDGEAVTVVTTEAKTIEALSAMVQLQDEFEQQLKIGGEFVGSNAWAISGKLTEDGNAILVNDPHVGIQIPSIWYMANLIGNKINASGMTIVGLPVIIFGRNQQIAWGGTNMMADVQDLYFEQINSTDVNLYMDKGNWRKFESEKQYIKVRPKFPVMLREAIKPVEVVVRKTVRGPVISDVFGLSDQPVTLRWTALDDNDTTYESFFRLNYASDWGTFKSALKSHMAPTLNFLYSDKQGNIGYMGAGNIPVRAKGDGQLPVVGNTGEYQWTGYIPFADWAQSYNPEKGYIVSANNKMVDDDYPYHISNDWAPADRANRIEQLIKQGLETDKTLSLDYMQNMQGDTVSFGSAGLVSLLKSAPMVTEKQKEAQQYIASWDGDMAADNQGASIFYSWSRYLRVVLFADNLEAPFGRTQHSGLLSDVYMNTTYNQIAAALTPGGAQWCDNTKTVAVENCEWAMQKALDMAIGQLSKLVGSDMDDWAWGEIHTTVYRHKPFSEVNVLKSLYERRVASGGGPNTINVGTASYVESEGFEQSFGAGFRQIMSLGQQDVTHRYMNSTGQSGNMFSQHYDDMVEPFSDVHYIDLKDARISTELVLKKLVNGK